MYTIILTRKDGTHYGTLSGVLHSEIQRRYDDLAAWSDEKGVQLSIEVYRLMLVGSDRGLII